MKSLRYCCIVAAAAGALALAGPLRAQSVQNLTFTPSNTSNQSLVGGAPSTGTVTLSAPAANNLTVTLTNTNAAAASVPVRVDFTAGQSSATFTLVSSVVTAVATTTITASANASTKSGTITVNPGFAQVLTTVRDAYIEGGTSANTNFGATTPLLLRQGAAGSDASNDAIIMNFDLTNVAAPPDSAVLRLYGVSPTGPTNQDFTYSVYVLPFVSWTENTITWNNCPDFNPSAFASTGTFVGTFTSPLTNGTVAIDVRSTVQLYTGRVITFFIMPASQQGANEFAFNSREAASGRPYLVLTYNAGLNDTPVPGWAEDTQAMDSIGGSGGDAMGMGPSIGNAVNLATGVFDHHPPPDMTVYNPVGPSVSYARRYRSSLAAANKGAPGLPTGWTDNWDYKISGTVGSFGPVSVRYPTHARETWTPVLSGTTPTGAFSVPMGTPYFVTGVPIIATTSWQSITVTFRDLNSITFVPSPSDPNTLYIGSISDPEGDTVTVRRNADNTIAEFDAGSIPLLHMTYTNNLLTTVSDAIGGSANPRTVAYTYGTISNYASPELTSVSQLYASGTPAARWNYGYNVYYGTPLLIATAAPNPSGTGFLTASATYDGSERVAFQTDANGNRRAYLYSGTTCRVEVRNPAQIALGGTAVTERWYQLTNSTRDAGVQDAAGFTATVTYDVNNNYDVGSTFNRNGQPSSVQYDNSAKGNPSVINVPCNDSSLAISDTWDYSLFPTGQLSTTKAGAKTPTAFTYYNGATSVGGVLQAKGLLASVEVPAPGSAGTGQFVTYSYVYTALGSLAQAIVPAAGPSGTVTYSLAYTGTMADGSVRNFEAKGEPVTVTDPIGNVTTYAYDAFGNVTAVTDAGGSTTVYTYGAPWDVFHQVTRVDFPKTNGSAGSPAAYWTFQYLCPGGPLDRVTMFTNTGDTTPFRTVTRSADGEDALKQVMNDALVVARTYDSLYRRVGMADGSAHSVTATYDGVGNFWTERFPLASGTRDLRTFQSSRNYDPEGFTDGNGNAITDTLALGSDARLISRGYPASPAGGVAGLNNATYGYDGLGRVTDVNNIQTTPSGFSGTAHLQYTYDDGDRLLTTTVTYVNAAGTAELTPFTITYTYNADGSRDSMTTPAGAYTYVYDQDGELTAEQMPWNETVFFVWSAGGKLVKQTTKLGHTNFSYSPAGHLAALTNMSAYADSAGNFVLSSFTPILHDASGNLTSETENVSAVHVVTGSYGTGTAGTVNYVFDTFERLTQENASNRSEPGGGGTDQLAATYIFGFTFDAANNMTALRTGTNAAASITVNADDQATSGTEFGTPFTAAFDGEGNPTTYFRAGTSTAPIWDLENRIANSGSYTATYRPDGLRAAKPSANTWFLYDGSVPIATVDGSGALTNAFGYGPAGLIERYPGTGTNFYWYTFDPCGSVVERTNFASASGTSGKIADWITRYDAFGAQLGCLNPSTGNEPPATNLDMVGFMGQYGAWTDQETYAVPTNTGIRYPLVHVNFTEYDPALGRLMNRNPNSPDGGINPYAFSGNNPVSGFGSFGQVNPGPTNKSMAVADVARSVNLGGVAPGQGSLARNLLPMLPGVLAGPGKIAIPAVPFGLPAVQRALPAVQSLLPAVQNEIGLNQGPFSFLTAEQDQYGATAGDIYGLTAEQLPAVQRMLPAVQSSAPGVWSLLPAVQFQLPAVQHGGYIGFPRTRIPFTPRAAIPATSNLLFLHALMGSLTGN